MFRRYCDPKIVEGIRGHFFAGRVLFPINHTVITVKQRNFEALDIVSSHYVDYPTDTFLSGTKTLFVNVAYVTVRGM